MGTVTGVNALFEWSRRITSHYGRSVEVTNMTSSWRDGRAFCAILHYYRPDLVGFDEIVPGNTYENNFKAFKVAESLGIPALLDAQDMTKLAVPDRLSIITYVAQLYLFFKNEKPRFTKCNFVSDTVTLPNEVKKECKESHIDNTCSICGSHVYVLERLIIDNVLMHRSCFKCTKCGIQLRMGLYRENSTVASDLPDLSTAKQYECLSHEREEIQGQHDAAAVLSSNASVAPIHCDDKAAVTDGAVSTIELAITSSLTSSVSPSCSDGVAVPIVPADSGCVEAEKAIDSPNNLPTPMPRRCQRSGATTPSSGSCSRESTLERRQQPDFAKAQLTSSDRPMPAPRRSKLRHSLNPNTVAAFASNSGDRYPVEKNPFADDDAEETFNSLNPFAAEFEGSDKHNFSTVKKTTASVNSPYSLITTVARKNSDVKGSDSEQSAKSDKIQQKIKPHRNYGKNRPAPPPPLPRRRKIVIEECLSMEEVNKGLDELEQKQKDFESRSRAIEQQLRSAIDEGNLAELDSLPVWFELINEKNGLFRREVQLIYMKKECELNALHAEIEYQLRCIVEKPESERDENDSLRENALTTRLLEVVNEKNDLIESNEDEMYRQHVEDTGISQIEGKLESLKSRKVSRSSSDVTAKPGRKNKERKHKGIEKLTSTLRRKL